METISALLELDTWLRWLDIETRTELLWVLFGLCAQGFFAARFLVQWIASERAGRSYVPLAFWYISLCGGASLLTYAIYQRDIVFILGQAFGLLVYTRNLMIIHGRRDEGGEP